MPLFAKKLLSTLAHQSKKTWLLAAGGLALLAFLGAAAYFASQTEEKTITTTTASVCPLPKKDYPEYAFSIGVPKGWIAEVDNGTIQIMEDETNTTAAFLYTAKLDKDLSPTEFLNSFADVFRTVIEGSGGSFSLAKISGDQTKATAGTIATVEEGQLAGQFLVEKESGFVTLKVYWAPKAKLTQKEAALKEVTGCFARTIVLDEQLLAKAGSNNKKQNPTLTAYKGQYFKVLLPEGWKVTGETDSGIDTSNADGSAGYSYAYVTGTPSAIKPATWASQQLQATGISQAKLYNTKSLPAQIQGQEIKEFDFSGVFKSKQVTGKTTVGVYNTPNYGFGSYGSAFMGIQIAENSLWEEVKSLTVQMQNSLEIIDIGSRKNIQLPPNRPIESVGGDALISSGQYRDAVNDKASQNWQEAMSGYEQVASPSTGTTYDAPLNSWNATGPDGAGYYRELPGGGGLEKLTPVE